MCSRSIQGVLLFLAFMFDLDFLGEVIIYNGKWGLVGTESEAIDFYPVRARISLIIHSGPLASN